MPEPTPPARWSVTCVAFEELETYLNQTESLGWELFAVLPSRHPLPHRGPQRCYVVWDTQGK